MASRKIKCLPFIKLIHDRAEISRSFLKNVRFGKNKSTGLVESRDVNIRRHFVRFGLPCHIVATPASVTIGLHEICGLISVTHSPSKLRRVWPRRVWAVWGCLMGMTGGRSGHQPNTPKPLASLKRRPDIDAIKEVILAPKG